MNLSEKKLKRLKNKVQRAIKAISTAPPYSIGARQLVYKLASGKVVSIKDATFLERLEIIDMLKKQEEILNKQLKVPAKRYRLLPSK